MTAEILVRRNFYLYLELYPKFYSERITIVLISWISDRFKVGQSITFIGTTGNVVTDIKVESLVMAWYNEVGSFNKDHVTSFKWVYS